MAQKKTGKPLRSFSFWFAVLGTAIVFLNLKGQDSKSIIMICLNPALAFLCGIEDCRDSIKAIPGAWHMLSMATMTAYGVLLDGFMALIRFINIHW